MMLLTMEIGYVILKLPEGQTACVRYGGTKLLSYTYDAWGNCTVTGSTTTGAQYNPFRYRGYYYDSELGVYYLNSRYYDANLGRFVNADDVSIITSTPVGLFDKNLYAYCDNNPIARIDSDGDAWHILIGAAVGVASAVVGQVISDVVTTVLSGELYYSSWETYAGAAIGGAVGGALFAATGNSSLASATSAGLSTASTMFLENVSGSGNHSVQEILSTSAQTMAMDYIAGGVLTTPKAKNITSGRNSYKSVYESGLKKIKNGTASKMSTSVMGKGVWSNVVANTPSSVLSGFENHWDGVKHYFGLT